MPAEPEYPLEELASLPEFRLPVASPSGDRVAFYYDGTGRNELYTMDVASGERRQVSDGEVPRAVRYPIAWHPDGDRLYFHRDEGGDEQNDVFEIALAGDVERAIERDGQVVLGDVGPDGRYLYYACDAGEQLNLYRRDVEIDADERLTSYDQPVRGGLVSPDGERIAYSTNESEDLDNRDVYVADADGSNARNLELGDHGAEASVAAWGPDGRTLLVRDNSTDLDRCGVYDLEDDAVTWYDGDAVERPVDFLPDGGFLALRTRRAAVVPVRYDREGAASELVLPEGVASFPGAYWPADPVLADGSVLVSQQTSSERKRLLAYDLATDEYEVLIEADYGDTDPDSFVEAEYVTYESTDGLEIGALLYDSGRRPSPAVVHVHGGPHGQSLRRFSPYVQFLVDRGYTVLQPNYRGSTGRGREFKNAVRGDWGGGEQDDVAAAGRWLGELEWIDEDRLAVMGGSYGGYSAYWQLTNYPELWDAGVARVGITDLLALYEESMPHFKTTLEQQLGDPDENEAFYRERSPITHVENVAAPICIVHGVNDPRCPISQARGFRDALVEGGLVEGEDFAYHELGEEGHGSSDIDQKIRSFGIVEGFLETHL